MQMSSSTFVPSSPLMFQEGAARSGVGPESGSISSSAAWLKDMERAILRTTEWKRLTRDIYEVVQTKMSENAVHFFSDLNEAEKRLLVDQAEQTLITGDSHKLFEHKLASLIDENLANAVRAASASSATSASVEEIIVGRASVGIKELLKDSATSESSTLSLLLNRELPSQLRVQIWKMLLVKPDAKRTYETRAAAGRRANMISKIDADIASKLQTIFDVHFATAAGNQNLFMAAKTVLSYMHVVRGDLQEFMYFLVLPFVLVYGASLSDVGSVVEGFSSLLAMARPRMRVLTADPSEIAERSDLASLFCSELKLRTPVLYAHFSQTISAEFEDPAIDSHGPIWADTFPLKAASMIVPAVERLFVGILNWPSCLYVWDQCIIVGHRHLVIQFSVAICAILKAQLMRCTSLVALQRTFKTRAKTISSRKLVDTMESMYMPKLRQDMKIPLRGQSSASVHPKGVDASLDDDLDDFQFEDAQIHRDRFGRRMAKHKSPSSGSKSASQVKAELEAKLSETAASKRRQSARSVPEIRDRSSSRQRQSSSPRKHVSPRSPRSIRARKLAKKASAEAASKRGAADPTNWCAVSTRDDPPAVEALGALWADGGRLHLSDSTFVHVGPIYSQFDGLADTVERVYADPRNARAFPPSSAPPNAQTVTETKSRIASALKDEFEFFRGQRLDWPVFTISRGGRKDHPACVRALRAEETFQDARALAAIAAKRGGIDERKQARLADAIAEFSALNADWTGAFDEAGVSGALEEFQKRPVSPATEHNNRDAKAHQQNEDKAGNGEVEDAKLPRKAAEEADRETGKENRDGVEKAEGVSPKAKPEKNKVRGAAETPSTTAIALAFRGIKALFAPGKR